MTVNILFMNEVSKHKIEELIGVAEDWLRKHDYHYVECNYVPERLFSGSRKKNMLLRTFYRLCPIAIRSKKDIANSPYTPHASVAMIKAYINAGNAELVDKLTNRVFDNLRSPKTERFSLKQGIRIAVNLYEDTADEPSPLNTLWFGETLLDNPAIVQAQKYEILRSICDYFINDLGYIDYAEEGIYFRYGHTIKNIIYNASAIISSFLIRIGDLYQIEEYIELGKKGISFIANRQNEDGSWFYYGPPLRRAIDGFHQSYVLKALINAQRVLDLGLDECIAKGVSYYRSQFKSLGDWLVPQRYDRRFNPKNTWVAQKIDGRDMSEALEFFSIYDRDETVVSKLVNYMYDKLYDKRRKRLIPEIFVYGVNRNDYIEFYGWYLNSLYIIKNTFADR